MPQHLYAGADWSGKADRPNEPFIFCVVALNDAEAWNQRCQELREQFRMAPEREFHGYLMKADAERLAMLQRARDLGMRIGAVICVETVRDNSLSYQSPALELLNPLFARGTLRTLWCDTEIQGKKARKAFETEVQRCHRAIHSQVRFEARVRDSHSSNLIQLADVMAYTLRTQAMGKVKSPALREFLKEIASDDANLILTR